MRTAGLILALCMIATGIRAEIIDRVAVSVGDSVITESEILRQIRITAMLNGTEPVFTPQQKRETAERLVEQMLIRREMRISRYTPDAADLAKEMFDAFRAGFPDENAWQAALSRYDIAEGTLKEAFDWQAMFLRFIGIRFRPGIQVSTEELRNHYEFEYRHTPEGRGKTFEEVEPKVEEVLTERLVDNAIERWLGQARTQVRIRYRAEAFE